MSGHTRTGAPRGRRVRVSRSRALAALLPAGLLLALLPGAAGAQETRPRDVLAEVSSPLLCREVPTTTADSAAHVFTFIDGDADSASRELTIAYDSAGAPLYLSIALTEDAADGEQRLEMFLARLSPRAFGERITVSRRAEPAADGGRGAPAAAPPAPRRAPIAAAELTRARELAQRLWQRRCAASR